MHPLKTPTNKKWPLPENYEELTPDEKQQARRDACSDISTPEAAVASWNFFRKYYLLPDEEADFDPGFFDHPLRPPARVHFFYVKWIFTHRNMLLGWPRRCGKTAMKRSVFLWLLVTQKNYSIVSFQSIEKFVLDEAEMLKHQLETNERILQDFGPQRPKKGQGLWNNHTLLLNNRSRWKGSAIDGRSRGSRADLVVFDDVEEDSEVEGQINEKRLVQISNRILKVAKPMLKGDQGKLVIQGTILGRASFLWRKGVTNEDPRFKSVEDGGRWFRLVLASQDANGVNIWPENYTAEYLAEQREMLGDAAFEQEFNNNPRAEGATPFNIWPHEHEYDVVGDGSWVSVDPLMAETTLLWHTVTRSDEGKRLIVPKREMAKTLFGNMTRALAVDYAATQNVTSDYSAIVAGGIDSDGCLWSLDGWHGKVRLAELAQHVWDLAYKWRVNHIYVEAVGLQLEIYHHIKATVEKMGSQLFFKPMVIPVKYPARFSKVDRIMGLESRFAKGLVKFPTWRRTSGTIGELYNQVRLFTTDLKNLIHDDVIDAFSILNWKMTGQRGVSTPTEEKRSTFDRIMAGEKFCNLTGMRLSTMLDYSTLTEAQVHAIIDMSRANNPVEMPLEMEDMEPGIDVGHGGIYGQSF